MQYKTFSNCYIYQRDSIKAATVATGKRKVLGRTNENTFLSNASISINHNYKLITHISPHHF
jgi:hypothetical protein